MLPEAAGLPWHPRRVLRFDRMQSLDDEVAAVLVRHRGKLGLDGLGAISPEVVQPGTCVTLLSGHIGNSPLAAKRPVDQRPLGSGAAESEKRSDEDGAPPRTRRGARGGRRRAGRCEAADRHASPCSGTWVTPPAVGTIVRERSCRMPSRSRPSCSGGR